jgi:16S rRNA (guanine(527)-N(7))-methyltransferase RsmG
MDFRTSETQTKVLAREVVSHLANYLDTIAFTFDRTRFLKRIERLAALIALWGARINLTAAPGDPGEIGFHIIDSLAPIIFSRDDEFLSNAFQAHSRVLDLGSGAGFPGLVLACASPATFTLLESRRKRASFLAVAVAEMGLRNVEVESGRLSHHSAAKRLSLTGGGIFPRADFDLVTARAFTTAPAFHSVAASALKSGGIAILYANPQQNLALAEAEKNGLGEFRRVAYMVPHNGLVVERVLGLWQRR